MMNARDAMIVMRVMAVMMAVLPLACNAGFDEREITPSVTIHTETGLPLREILENGALWHGEIDSMSVGQEIGYILRKPWDAFTEASRLNCWEFTK